MKKIKGLLLKDILELRAYRKNLLFIIAIYGLLIYTNKETNMASVGVVMIMLVFTMLVINTFHYDDKTKSDRYLLTLSLTKKELVMEKYILSFLAMLVGAIVGLFFSLLLTYVKNNMLPNTQDMISTILGGMVAVSFISTIQIPFIYKYGVEKGRLFIYLVAMVIFILSNLLVFTKMPDLSFLDKYDYFLPIVAILLVFLLYGISYLISYKIFIKKEV